MTREEAIKGLKVLRRDFSGYKPNEEMIDMAIKALEQQSCDDCISRQAVLDMMQMKMGGKELYKAVYDLPSVTPQLKTGHWEWVQYDGNCGNWHCSECRHIARYSLNKDDRGGVPWFNYCPVCGAKMEVEHESD